MARSLEYLGFRRLLRSKTHGRNLKILSPGPASNLTVRGTINRIGAFTLTTELGDDPRGKRVLEIMKEGAPLIQKENILLDLGSNEKFKAVDIGLDSPEYSLKFELQQGVKGKDDWA